VKISLVSMPVPDPIKAHEIYTTKLGFISKEFDKKANLAIVVSSEDPNGAAILLEPCTGNFAGKYQKSAFDANMPIMVLAAKNAKIELERLESVGIQTRPELDKPEWGLTNMFEDGCGNLLMIEEIPG